MKPKGVEVVGLSDLNAAVRKAKDQGLRKRLGQANKSIGQLVISKLRPRPVPQAVGTGAGAEVRAAAAMREVQLKAGGAHRTHLPFQQWGRVHVGSFGPAPARPFILRTAEYHRREIEDAYMEAVAEAMRPAFWRVDI